MSVSRSKEAFYKGMFLNDDTGCRWWLAVLKEVNPLLLLVVQMVDAVAKLLGTGCILCTLKKPSLSTKDEK